MPVLIGWILNGLRLLFATRLGLWIAAALTWLGIGFGSFKVVIEPAMNAIRGHAQAVAGGDLAVAAQAWLGVLQFDKAITMILSAYAAKHALQATKLFLTKRT